MPSAGELLRNERLQRQRGLSEIASETRISVRYLEAIETDDIGILPGDFFYRSFIRQYATALGLDESAIKHILEAVEPAPEIDPLPTFALPQQIAEVEQRSKPLAQVPTRVAVALFLVVVGLLLGPLRDLEPRPRVVRRATRGGGNRRQMRRPMHRKVQPMQALLLRPLLRRPRRRFPQRLSRRPRSQKPFRRIPRKST